MATNKTASAALRYLQETIHMYRSKKDACLNSLKYAVEAIRYSRITFTQPTSQQNFSSPSG